MYALVLTTIQSKKDGQKLAQGLLKEGLVACVNILGPIESHFVWKKKICCEKEYQLMMKTKEQCFEKVKAYLLKHHPYEVPEIILLPIKKGWKKYLEWIDEVLS
ncbi:MAG: divalent-cation tolerance protein CutA [Chlamydiae bacterium]|nr:divalent-cation tolerance protein CutA [Chlamydiota bacterium]MBI3276609.1 divalent-cation tolerance protein CutA [Chlamydiota bacterium]